MVNNPILVRLTRSARFHNLAARTIIQDSKEPSSAVETVRISGLKFWTLAGIGETTNYRRFNLRI